ncbi:MAG: histidine phosphatase family protein [Rhodocyclaceae bacterium]|nr:histidine phosphatase family protein [Rhodocyclaceae bacterium]MBX3670143.1 histidine phosphatase family protein [Rhodocyclaceae bacterium]
MLFPPQRPFVRFCLVRHGETDWNAERRIQGQLDIALNAHGDRQAHATAAQLAHHRFAAIYASDLVRAHSTAAAVAHRLALPVLRERGLRERHYGAWQGRTYAEIAHAMPDDYARFERRDPQHELPGGGESLTHFQQRVAACLGRLAQGHAGEQILVVTHGGVLDIAYRLAMGRALDAARDFEIPNAALNWLEHGPKGWRLLAWAQKAHLAAARDELP